MAPSASHTAFIAVGVTTLGRWEALHALVDDLSHQTVLPNLVVVCSQAEPHSEPEWLCAQYRFPVIVIHSSRGLSRGRNAILSTIESSADYVIFSNDTSRLGPGVIGALVFAARTGATAYACVMHDALGARNTIPRSGTPLTRATVWAAIEPATLLNVAAIARIGAFDIGLGTGANTPWQAGEITDLLLRAMRDLGSDFSVEWKPDIVIEAAPETKSLTQSEAYAKLRAYGRGTGYVYRRWNYPWFLAARFLVGALIAPLRSGAKRRSPAEALQLFLGRLEGLRGRTLPGSAHVIRAARR